MSEIDDLLNECLKLAAQEKITTKNSWDLALIDRISEVFDPNDCDFVRVSGAINASAKIYSGRVDKLYQDCISVASLTGTHDDAEETPTRGRGAKNTRQKNAKIDAEPGEIRLQIKESTRPEVYAKLYIQASNPQQIHSLAISTMRCNDVGVLGFPDYDKESANERIEPDDDVEAELLCDQVRNILSQSQHYGVADIPNQNQVAEFICSNYEPHDYTSMLDNSQLTMEVSQLADDQVDFFMTSGKFMRQQAPSQPTSQNQSVNVSDIEEPTRPQGPNLPRPKKLPKPGLPRAQPARTEVEEMLINFGEICDIPLVAPKQRSKVYQKTFKIEELDPPDLFSMIMPRFDPNQLMLSDFQPLTMSQLAQLPDLSVINSRVSMDSVVNLSLAGQTRVQFQDSRSEEGAGHAAKESQFLQSTYTDYATSEATERHYDVHIGLKQVQIKFQQKPKVINILQLKNQLREEMAALQGQTTFQNLVDRYPEFHTERVCRHVEDVSKAYQFVALLHLANEDSLQLVQQGAEIAISQ